MSTKAKSSSRRAIQNRSDVQNAPPLFQAKSSSTPESPPPNSDAPIATSTGPLSDSELSGKPSLWLTSLSSLIEAVQKIAQALTDLATLEEKKFQILYPERTIHEATLSILKKNKPGVQEPTDLYDDKLWLGPREKKLVERQKKLKKTSN